MVDVIGLLGDGDRNTRNVDLLESISSDKFAVNVGADAYHGNAVHICSSDSRYKIGSAGAGSGEDHAGLTGSSGVSVSCMGGALFVSAYYVGDPVLISVELVIDIQGSASGVSEYGIDPVIKEHFTYDL